MAFTGIFIECYEDMPQLSTSGNIIHGNLISSIEDTSISGTEVTAALPGNCTYISVIAAANTYIEIDTGTPDAASGRRALCIANVEKSFNVGPQTAGAKKVAYVVA
jgi:hypothetical protein